MGTTTRATPDKPPSPATFQPTRWTLVVRARGTGAEAAGALDELCRLYWLPLYHFARRRGLQDPDARDAVQGFFGELLAHRDGFGGAERGRGRLRNFLLKSFIHHLGQAHHRRTADKRGGQFIIESLNDHAHALDALPDTVTPETAYERAWGLALLRSAMRAVEHDWRARAKAAEFDALASFIDPANGGEGDYAPAAARLGCEPGHARVLVHRLRKAYRAAVLAAVADTLEHATPAAVEEELAALVAVFG